MSPGAVSGKQRTNVTPSGNRSESNTLPQHEAAKNVFLTARFSEGSLVFAASPPFLSLAFSISNRTRIGVLTRTQSFPSQFKSWTKKLS
jgi:hypothetical protein